MPVVEVATPYKERPEGSVSKLSTWSDGSRVLWTILRLFVAERPLTRREIATLAGIDRDSVDALLGDLELPAPA